MHSFVLDSSVIVKFFAPTNEPHINQALKILQQVKAGKSQVFIPDLSLHEINNAFIKKQLTHHAVSKSFQILFSLPIYIESSTQDLLVQAHQIAVNYSITPYDAIFVALAQHLNLPLITANPKHQAKVKTIQVIPLKDFS